MTGKKIICKSNWIVIFTVLIIGLISFVELKKSIGVGWILLFTSILFLFPSIRFFIIDFSVSPADCAAFLFSKGYC